MVGGDVFEGLHLVGRPSDFDAGAGGQVTAARLALFVDGTYFFAVNRYAHYPSILLPTLVVFLLCYGCGAPERSAFFVEVAAEAGLYFRHTSGASGDYFLIETMGAGAAFFDYDNDGWLDVYLVDGFDLSPWRERLVPVNLVAGDSAGTWVVEDFRPPLRYDGRVDTSMAALRQAPGAGQTQNRLYQNKGGAFREVTAQTGTGDLGYGMGVAVGDYDNDGRADLYVTNYGRNAFYHNQEDGTFAERAQAAGVADPHWSTSAAFFDYDNDGDLDLYVANYLDLTPDTNRLCGGAVASAGASLRVPAGQRTYCSPRRYNGAPDVLFRNEGDGHFSEVAQASGVFSPFGKGLGVAAADFDSDGLLDVYVANDGTRNFFYRNRGDGTFAEAGLAAGAAYNGDGQAEAGMGVAVGDGDADGDADLLVTNFSRESNTLYRNEGDGRFADATAAADLRGPTLLPLGFGAFFADVDNDADMDLFVANGHVLDRIALQDSQLTHAQPNQLFANDGRGTFADVSARSGPAFGLSAVSRGAAYGDCDNDGDLDLLVTNVDGAARLYRNELRSEHHWLSLRLVGTRANRDAVGARVRVFCGGAVQTRQRIGGGTYLSASDSRLHFGLGDCALVERIEITWPDGSVQERRSEPVDRFLVVEQE